MNSEPGEKTWNNCVLNLEDGVKTLGNCILSLEDGEKTLGDRVILPPAISPFSFNCEFTVDGYGISSFECNNQFIITCHQVTVGIERVIEAHYL